MGLCLYICIVLMRAISPSPLFLCVFSPVFSLATPFPSPPARLYVYPTAAMFVIQFRVPTRLSYVTTSYIIQCLDSIFSCYL